MTFPADAWTLNFLDMAMFYVETTLTVFYFRGHKDVPKIHPQ